MNGKNPNEGIICKNCGAGGVLKYGTYKGVQRYFCKDCGRQWRI